jgi:hypothetical protein
LLQPPLQHTDNRPAPEAAAGAFVPTELRPQQEPLTRFDVIPVGEAGEKVERSELVLGVTIGQESRAYPLNMLAGREDSSFNPEVLNDTLGGRSVAVTWCDLCHSGIVYSRQVGGRKLTFGVAGMVWQGNLVMYDRETVSLWSQLAGEAKEGPLKGKQLERFPAVITNWGRWMDQHAGGTVALLSRNARHYRVDFYPHYGPQYLVLGLVAGDTARAWGFDRLAVEPVVNDRFGGRPVLVAFDPEAYTGRVYERVLGERVLTFRLVKGELTDDQSSSTWELLTGRAAAGPLRGRRLVALPAVVANRKVWLKFYPRTTWGARAARPRGP